MPISPQKEENIFKQFVKDTQLKFTKDEEKLLEEAFLKALETWIKTS